MERALRVLDGAILVLCSVGGVQSQTITVDRQMKRYGVPRVCFVNKLDRAGANPLRVIEQIKAKIRINAAAVQMPIGLEADHRGVVCLLEMRALSFAGEHGERVEAGPVPPELLEEAEARRLELVEAVSDVDDELAEMFIAEERPSAADLRAAVRRATLSLQFAPVFMGSAFKNKGVQPLLDGVLDFLPSPVDRENAALDVSRDEARLALRGMPDDPLVALAFKLEETRYGQLTYVRVYQGTLRKGDTVVNVASGKRIKLPRLVRMHSNEMEEVAEVRSGEIAALFGVECSSGDTFCHAKPPPGSTAPHLVTMESMRVPEPVMSLAIECREKGMSSNFSKALQKFTREDPTFRVSLDPDSHQTIISGMGELHLEIYCERLRREYKVDVEVGKPRVNFREALTRRAEFDYLHKKQSGGQGQFGRVTGYIEPMGDGEAAEGGTFGAFEFVNELFGNNIPPNFVPHIEKGFREASNTGALIGHPVDGLRVVLQDGAAHAVDSSEIAFKIAALNAFRDAYGRAEPTILEPLMRVEITAPVEFQGPVVASVNRRKGLVINSEQEGDDVVLEAEVPLNNMFGYSTDLRSMTQGKGEFAMQYARHTQVSRELQAELTRGYAKQRQGGGA